MIPAAVYRIAPVVNVFSTIVMIFSLTMTAPLLVAYIYNDAALLTYNAAIVITFGCGALMRLFTMHQKRELQPRDGFLLVFLVWTILPAFATLPLMLYIDGLSFTDAYFETASGITTTGATTLTNLEQLPPSINFWRLELEWLGGMGLIVLAVAILPLLGVGGMQIYKAETPGPMKDTKLTPRITETAKGLWLIYAGITLANILAYRWAGMSWFDAVSHSFSTMSLGGFSTYDASFGFFDSPLIEGVAIVFMLIAGINFATHFLAWRERSPRPYRADPEAAMFVMVTLASCLMIAVYLWRQGVYPDFLTALRYASFNVVSIATTTGYANTDYNLWPAFAPLWMLFLCCFASSSGSTGGGIKMIRAQLLVRQGLREMLKLVHPRAQVPVKLGGGVVPNQIVFAVLAFMSIYGACVTVMTFLLLVTGVDFLTAFSAVIASINNTGPGLNLVGPATTYAVLTDFQTWVLTIAMLLGRLELFTLLVLFTPAFWRR
ncbi:MAG: TrkH family potassium uptake protein [Betaproteobacteria bacterium]|nr:TrkH family potassium uptake protein [Betaproteobacteria bacterium]